MESINWNKTLVNANDPILRTPCIYDPFETDLVWQTIELDMLNLMEERIGIGLAAPQLGNSVKMFVMKHSELGNIGVYNPEITFTTEETVSMEEGCLSFPGLFFHVTRPEGVKVKFFDKKQKQIELELHGMDARCFQHEADHLNGILHISYASDLKLQRAIKKRDKLLKKYANMKRSVRIK